jgi:seryl-tRNA synthetase
MPYYDHRAWLDELEAAMKTTEFLEARRPIQNAVQSALGEHNQFLQQAAQAQAQAQASQGMQNAVAQAVQQAAAQAAADTVTEVQQQMRAQQMSAPQIPHSCSRRHRPRRSGRSSGESEAGRRTASPIGPSCRISGGGSIGNAIALRRGSGKWKFGSGNGDGR